MSKYAGTKTEANLRAAFAGESQARNQYTFFASVAKKEGYEQMAALFLKTAENEKEHAKLWLKELSGIGDTKANLAAAAAGENYEWTDMYAAFAADARAERDDDGALRAAAAAEQRLAQRRGVCVVAEVDGKRSMRAQRASQVEVHKIQVRRKAHDAARVVHRAGAADDHAADGVLADRELRDDLTDASRDRLGAEIDARRDRMLL